MKKIAFAAGLCCMLGAANMFAGTITESCTFSEVGPPTATTCTVAGFNNSIGSLVSVTWSLSAVTGSVQASVSNLSTTTAYTFNGADATLNLTVKAPDNTQITGSQVSTANGVGECSGTVNPSSTYLSCGVSGLLLSNFGNGNTTTGNNASFTGGTLSFSETGSLTNFNVNAPGAPNNTVFGGGNGLYDGTITVTFNYNGPAPEPGTILLAACGFLGLGIASRRRQRKA